MKKVWTFGDHQLAYEEAGSGNLAVLLIHGFCGNSRYWRNIIPELATAGLHVIVPDLRGHGLSTFKHDALSLEHLAEDMALLLDHLGIDRAHVIGHSLGGYTALAFAERYESRVESLGLVHSTAYPDTEEGKANRFKGIATIRDQGIRVYVDGLIPKLFAPSYLDTSAEIVQDTIEIGYATDPKAAELIMMAMRDRPDRNAVLEQLAAPILLIAGESDQIISPERVFSLRRPSIQCELIKDTGHMSMLESPLELNRILRDFLLHGRQ